MSMKICKGCGEQVDSSAKVCPKCGKDRTHPVLRAFLIVFLIIGVITTVAISLIAETNILNYVIDTLSAAFSNTSTSKETIIYNVGDIINMNNYEITITAAHQKNKVGTKYSSSTPSEGGIYIAIDFKYKNISDKPLNMWNFPTVKLVDGNGVEYHSDINASSCYEMEKNTDSKFLSNLNPGITVTDSSVFEISSESYNDNEWFVLIDFNVRVKIK